MCLYSFIRWFDISAFAQCLFVVNWTLFPTFQSCVGIRILAFTACPRIFDERSSNYYDLNRIVCNVSLLLYCEACFILETILYFYLKILDRMHIVYLSNIGIRVRFFILFTCSFSVTLVPLLFHSIWTNLIIWIKKIFLLNIKKLMRHFLTEGT